MGKMSEEEEFDSDDEAPEEVTTSKETSITHKETSDKSLKKKQRGGKKKSKKMEPAEAEVMSEDILQQAANDESTSKRKTITEKQLKRELKEQAQLNNSRHKRFNEIQSSKAHKKSRDDNFVVEVLRADLSSNGTIISEAVKPTSEAVSFSEKLISGGSHSRVRMSRSAFNSQQIRGAPRQFTRKK